MLVTLNTTLLRYFDTALIPKTTPPPMGPQTISRHRLNVISAHAKHAPNISFNILKIKSSPCFSQAHMALLKKNSKYPTTSSKIVFVERKRIDGTSFCQFRCYLSHVSYFVVIFFFFFKFSEWAWGISCVYHLYRTLAIA